ncbi:DUF1540 domain-containing protein [Anaerostipes caccae]|uniref:DUF1540 domain-containing protein n=1 Tax=Anaerostipes caccae TaxID=105841 RepID=UPI00101BD838|nr:DUF1540 domain-containing protein [Anaerostipes caccae]
MKSNGKNDCIECTINNCAYHAGDVDYCTLETIKIGTHEPNPTTKECTDCVMWYKKS